MATALQRQVSKLRSDGLQAIPLHQGRASLFLDPKEAAGIDVGSIFDTASAALSVLQQYDERFQKFHDTLLHPSSQSLQRELKTSEVSFIILFLIIY